ncbi:DUF559 domain-containing protein [Nocardia sp. NPDC051030]|uniref:DUF559 domain-containing protein n=1 Tax=Nocardia sp. NPDC051030 TaxID=3155162 RepID=UPI00342C6D22
MGWRKWKLAVEYDGAQHWTNKSQHSWDIDRHALLHSLGWTIIRASADHLRHRPHSLLARVQAAIPDEHAMAGANAENSSRPVHARADRVRGCGLSGDSN